MLLVGAGSQAQPAAERAFGPSALRRLLDCATELTGHIPLVLQGEGTYLAGLGLMGLAAFGTLFICGGIQGYQVFVGDLRGAGALEWPLRALLVIGGFVVATPGGGIMPLSQLQITCLGLAILIPTVLIALLLVRRQALVPGELRSP